MELLLDAHQLDESYDVIVVGGGTSGSVLASRLAAECKNLQILLVEAGGANTDASKQILGKRYSTFKTRPGYNWGYQTVPQQALHDRIIDYSKGKGLGGGTAINFCCYTKGSSGEYDRWAQLVDDDIENYHQPSADQLQYVNPSGNLHGHSGPLDIGFSDTWERGFVEFLEAAYASDLPKNLDVNSGNPVGIAVNAMTGYRGQRITASSAYLSEVPPNLTIKTDTTVERVVFEADKAVGIDVPGRRIFAKKEVILSAGAVESPKLLLLSGIGPKSDLDEHRIKVVRDIPDIGKGLRDHCFTLITIVQKPRTNDRPVFFNDPDALKAAQGQWMTDHTGPLTVFQCAQTISFLIAEAVFQSREFEDLEKVLQVELRKDSIPTYEMLSHTRASPKVPPEDCYLSFVVAFMNPQSKGEITLSSIDPFKPPLIDPQFLSHPFDRRVAIEAVRDVLDLLDKPEIAKDTVRLGAGPSGRSDEEILDYVKETGTSMWHSVGTVKMGRIGDPETCVDKNFRVVGVQGLRVVDASVAPLIPSAHTQAAAFLIGEVAAEKLIAEYS
ncbi:MAG: hypothetical protein MMC33_007622 [Icmadophila ericetorum]|nr:hypothetical protein [Icmadophila ericetorum]